MLPRRKSARVVETYLWMRRGWCVLLEKFSWAIDKAADRLDGTLREVR
jgi:hypothetical protein